MRYNKLTILFLFIFIQSCSSKVPKNDLNKDLNTKYEKAKKFFGAQYTNHFPEKVDIYTITFSEGFSPDLGDIELIRIDSLSADVIGKTIDKLNNKSIAVYQPNDSCLLIVNRFATKDNYYKVV